MDRSHRQRWCSLTICRKTTSVLADGPSCTFADVAQWEERGHAFGRGHEFETRHPLHFGCVHALRGHATWCWWSGMCAVQGLSHVQRDTTSDGMLAFGHSRSGVSCSSSWPRTPLFQGGHAGSNPARDTSSRSLCRAHASRAETGRNDWAAPEPVTGWILGGVAQYPVEQPPCKRQAAGSNPVTSTNATSFVNP
jgi:hypothetical protein